MVTLLSHRILGVGRCTRFYAYVGRKVDVRFDPLNLDAVEIWFNGQKIRLAKELKINADREWKTDSVEVAAPTDSRYLKALEQNENH